MSGGNVLIVESENDKYFIEALIAYLNISNINVDSPVCSIHDYECLGGLSKLQGKLSELEERIKEENINKIGIILDANQVGIQERVELINQALKTIDENLELSEPNQFIKSEKLDVEIACHILNIDGRGELETVLKAIKSNNSIFADCLNTWKKCVEEKGKTVKDKEFDKFWINVYQRYDCCSEKEQKQAGRKCDNESSMKKAIWNFESPQLDELRSFLGLFASNTLERYVD